MPSYLGLDVLTRSRTTGAPDPTEVIPDSDLQALIEPVQALAALGVGAFGDHLQLVLSGQAFQNDPVADKAPGRSWLTLRTIRRTAGAVSSMKLVTPGLAQLNRIVLLDRKVSPPPVRSSSTW